MKTLSLNIHNLRKLCLDDNIVMTAHVVRRCYERNIEPESIIKTIMQGEIIKQYEDDKPHPSCLILGKDNDNKYLHVVVASDDACIQIITAYYPNCDEWETDFRTRKGRKK